MVTHVNSRPDEQYQFSKVVNLGPAIHQSKLSNENCNILQRLTIFKFCRNGSTSEICSKSLKFHPATTNRFNAAYEAHVGRQYTRDCQVACLNKVTFVKSVQSALSDLLTISSTHGMFSRPSTKRGLILIGLELNTNAKESFEHC